MPEILRHGPYRVLFYSNEGDPREPAHVHVHAGSAKAKVWLLPDVELAYNRGHDAKALRFVIALVEHHRERCLRAWNDHFR